MKRKKKTNNMSVNCTVVMHCSLGVITFNAIFTCQRGLINAIENVQRYFTRILLWPETMPYYERLALFDLELLELRCIKCDMYY